MVAVLLTVVSFVVGIVLETFGLDPATLFADALRSARQVVEFGLSDVRQVGRELGVRYVLEGSVRRGGNYLRFTAQLIDATSGAHIWADRFEGETSDVFALQDRITESVVGAIEPNLQRAEIERLKQKPSANLDAYDLLLRAHQLVYEFTPDSLTAALEYLKRSLDIDPQYAPAMAMRAYCYYLRRYQSWSKDIEAEAAEAIRLSLRAVELASDDANVLWMAGMAIWPLPGELRRGTDWVRRSLEINPNSAMALTVMGWIEAVGGDKEKALQLLTQARRLSPRDPSAWFTFCGLAIVYLDLRDTKSRSRRLKRRSTIILATPLRCVFLLQPSSSSGAESERRRSPS